MKKIKNPKYFNVLLLEYNIIKKQINKIPIQLEFKVGDNNKKYEVKKICKSRSTNQLLVTY